MIVDEAVKRILDIVMTEDGIDWEQRPRRGGRSGERLPARNLKPEPFTIPPEAEHKIESLRPHPEEIEVAGEDILGSYAPMLSPGVITLDWSNIGSLFWHTVLDMQRNGFYMEECDMEGLATLTVLKTYRHERFHHFSNVARILFGRAHNHDMEEALAVACSYRDISDLRDDGRSKIARLPSLLCRELILRIYRYSASGYRDWVNFQTVADFERGLVEYLGPPSASFLHRSGVDVAAILGALRQTVGTQQRVERLTP